MRQATVKRRISRTYSVPAPTKGWNSLDSIALMDEKYAVILKNFIPTSSSVALRKGSSSWATGITGTVETLAAYNSTNSSKLFAAAVGVIYDVSSSGAATSVVTGKNNARWQHVNFATTGGRYMYMVNGVDYAMLYDGNSWLSIDGTATSLLLAGTYTYNIGDIASTTRATTATYYNSSGVIATAAIDTPRFTYNPTTLALSGLLVENASTNNYTYSEQFDNAAWSKVRSSITANATTAPDGAATADKLVEDASATNSHRVSESFAYTSGNTYTISCYFKAAERTQVSFRFLNTAFGTSASVYFDLSAGTVISTGTGISNVVIQALPNGWYRCSAAKACTITATGGNITIDLAVGGSNTYSGDGVSGLYLWGAQLETTGISSYIPTVAATVTRAADTIYVNKPAITGIGTNTFINVTLFKNRLWFVEANSMRAWYLPTASIAGAANVLDLSSLFPRGGYLMAMGDWTLDSGQGVDDYAVFISSEGEVAVYQGTDPAVAANWSLVGIYQIGSPIGRRCMVKFASDLLIINQDGLQLMSAALSSSRAYAQQSVTDKIQPTISQSIISYGSNFGWEVSLHSKEDCILMNIPVTGGSQQYVMNTRTKGWCNFTGWNASCFEIMNDVMYFGTSGGVMKAFDGTSDNGSAIAGEALQAFSYMGSSNIKYFEMARPIVLADTSNIGILLGLNVDYDISAPIGTPTFSGSTLGTWDSALWDAGVWGGDLSIRKDWQTVGGIGYAGALHMKTQSSIATLQWAATDYVFQLGSGIV